MLRLILIIIKTYWYKMEHSWVNVIRNTRPCSGDTPIIQMLEIFLLRWIDSFGVLTSRWINDSGDVQSNFGQQGLITHHRQDGQICKCQKSCNREHSSYYRTTKTF